VDKTQFSTRPSIICEDLPNEVWKTCYYSINYEVSNLGRVRNKRTKVLSNCCEQKDGYVSVSFENTNYRLHRAVLATFNPIENMEDFTVDHINGIRNDNRVENLRWVSNEENILLMTTNRLKLNSEITRLISKYGYDETLAKLKAL
jgi:NAD+--asparagine ADP-ribosyltransferase